MRYWFKFAGSNQEIPRELFGGLTVNTDGFLAVAEKLKQDSGNDVHVYRQYGYPEPEQIYSTEYGWVKQFDDVRM